MSKSEQLEAELGLDASAADSEEVGPWFPEDFAQQQQTEYVSSLEESAQQLDQTVHHRPWLLDGH